MRRSRWAEGDGWKRPNWRSRPPRTDGATRGSWLSRPIWPAWLLRVLQLCPSVQLRGSGQHKGALDDRTTPRPGLVPSALDAASSFYLAYLSRLRLTSHQILSCITSRCWNCVTSVMHDTSHASLYLDCHPSAWKERSPVIYIKLYKVNAKYYWYDSWLTPDKVTFAI